MKDIPSILKILFITTVAIVVISYAHYKTRDLSHGPTIAIASPANGSTIYNSLVKIRGVAESISYLSMNDRQIFTNETGEFEEELLLSSGYNIISIKASDKFERSIESTLELIYIKRPEKIIDSVATNKTTPKLDLELIESAEVNTGMEISTIE